MPSFRGQRVFRQRGQYQDHSNADWQDYARKAVQSGGRIVASETGEHHIVSPSGAHWGTYNTQQGRFQGGTLQRFEGNDRTQDITEDYLG